MPVIGHQKQKEYLIKSFKSNNLFPTILFHGPSGIGKKHLALDFIQYVFCDQHNNCETCGNCLRMQKQEHENLFLVQTNKNTIKIEEVRDLISKLYLQSQSEYRFVVIDECEKLTTQAANALLKTLEEPPPKTYFILITSNKNSLLPTIRSRAISLSFGSLNTEDLKKLSHDAPSWIYQAAEGRPGLFFNLQETEAIEDRKIAIDLLQLNLKTSRFEAFQKIKESLSKANRWDRIFYFMLSLIRDSEVFHINPDLVNNKDQMQVIQSIANLDEDMRIHYFESVKKLQRQFLANQDKTLCLENLWLNWHPKHVSISP